MAGEQTQRLLTKDLLLATGTRFFSSVVFTLLNATLAMFAIMNFDIDTGQAGIVVGVFMLGSLLVRPFAGIYTDIIGRRKVLIVISVISLVIAILYFLPMNLYLFILLRFVHGAAIGIMSTAINAVSTTLVPEDRLGEGLGIYSMGAVIATAFGPFLGLILLDIFGFWIVFAMCLVSSILILLTVIPMTIRELDLSEEDKLQMKDDLRHGRFLDGGSISVSICAGMCTLCYSGVIAFIALYAKSVDQGAFASVFFIAYSAVAFFSRPYMGRVMDRRGDNAAVLPSFIFFTAGFIVLVLLPNLVGFVVCGVLMALGYSCAFTTLFAVAVRNAPAERVALASATYYTFADTGQGIGPAILGMLIPLIGYQGMYLVCAAVVLAMIAYYWATYGSKRASKGSSAQQ